MRSKLLREFGAQVRRRRKQLQISQDELAYRAGLHRTYIGGIERGERNIGIENLAKIAGALTTSMADLLRPLGEGGRG